MQTADPVEKGPEFGNGEITEEVGGSLGFLVVFLRLIRGFLSLSLFQIVAELSGKCEWCGYKKCQEKSRDETNSCDVTIKNVELEEFKWNLVNLKWAILCTSSGRSYPITCRLDK